jgi:serine/threonine protein kinase
MPSLTSRIALCHALSEIVEKLHAVDWVHKGLRSHNVIFFKTDDDDNDNSDEEGDDWSSIDFTQPYISGFDYSRPAQNEELTEKPPENAAYDIYRHPRVHGSALPRDPNTSPYKKSYDIYSLGIILLEIAYWKPIDVVLGIDLATARPSTTIKVKQRLWEETRFLKYVRGNLGDKVWEVVRACLTGIEAFGLGRDDDERISRVKEDLQIGYYDVVVKRLGEVKV